MMYPVQKKQKVNKDKKMHGGHVMYGHGGHVSIRDMEKACNKMAGYQESSQRKEDK